MEENLALQTRASIWWQSIRPKTLLAAFSPIILALAQAWKWQNGQLAWGVAALTLACALLLQITANLCNDYFDAQNGVDQLRRWGPARAVSLKLLPAWQMQWAFRASALAAFLAGAYLMYRGGWPIVLVGIFALLATYAYTAGPWPLSHHALGEVAAFIFFGPVALWGALWLQMPQLARHTWHGDLPWILLLSSGPGLLAAALMAVNNLRDRESDALANKRTLATRLGQKQARYLPIFLVALAALPPLALLPQADHYRALLPLLPLLLWMKRHARRLATAPIDAGLNVTLAHTGLCLFLYSLLFALALLCT